MPQLINPDWRAHWFGVPEEVARQARGLGFMIPPVPLPVQPANGIDIDYHTPPVEVACPNCPADRGWLWFVGGIVVGALFGAAKEKT